MLLLVYVDVGCISRVRVCVVHTRVSVCVFVRARVSVVLAECAECALHIDRVCVLLCPVCNTMV